MDLPRKLALYHKIGMPIYFIAAIALAFLYPLTRETLVLFLITYSLQALGISVGFHRLFSHRSFQGNRIFIFLLALCGGLAGQGTIRRWVSQHRKHHQYTDQPGDPHSPHVFSFWFAHIGWRFDEKSYDTDEETKKIWSEWPIELKTLDQFIPTLFLVYPVLLFFIGGWAFVEWGCVAPIVLLWNVTFTINSISHRFGTRYFETQDESRNNLWLALLMWGEGWHNNHHASPKNIRFGMRWFQIDFGYYLIKTLEKFGITHHLVENSDEQIRNSLKASVDLKRTQSAS